MRGETLADSLGEAEDVDRISGLVGRDVDEPLDTGVDGRPQDILHAEDVRLHALGRMPFEERDMLVGGCVEHDVGPVPPEDGDECIEVADVRQDQFGILEQRPSVEPKLQRMEAVLGVIEHEKASRTVRPHRFTEL